MVVGADGVTESPQLMRFRARHAGHPTHRPGCNDNRNYLTPCGTVPGSRLLPASPLRRVRTGGKLWVTVAGSSPD